MSKIFARLLLFSGFVLWNTATAQAQDFTINSNDVIKGVVAEKIWLQAYVKPSVGITKSSFSPIVSLPKGAKEGKAGNVVLTMGMERKRPFVIVSIPVYSKDAQGNLQQLSSFSLDIKETTGSIPGNLGSLEKTTGVDAPLATGTWYKIAVPARGVYKIDGNFIQSKLGVNLSSVTPANIRIFGNGGSILSEDNSVARPSNLLENAIFVSTGASTFSTSDYILLYANGPMGWAKDSINQQFVHQKNIYADSSYYFINFDQGAGLRIGSQNGNPAANETITSFNDYQAHDTDIINLGKIGKLWWGESFGTLPSTVTSRNFSFPIGTLVDSLKVKMLLGSRSSGGPNVFSVSLNGQQMANSPYSLGLVDLGDGAPPIAPLSLAYSVANVGSTATFTISYAPYTYDGLGYLDNIELNYRRALIFPGGILNFRDWRSVGPNKVAAYQLQNANSNTQVWDITNPQQPVMMNGVLNGSTYSFTQEASILHEFVAIDGSQYGSPQFSSTVDNQNIHGSAAVDLVIVTSPLFLQAANNLAAYHQNHDNFRTLVVTTTQVYNEFSSGGEDISAIRDMMRMFYKNAGADTSKLPKYLLLFGDASYDYKNRLPSNTNYVPTFESAESIDVANSSFTVDDFFGFLDDNENIENLGIANTLDIGVGRLPVDNETEALAVVNKITNYTNNAATLGPWRLANTYIADNEDDAGTHLEDAEDMVATVNATTNIYNDTKIYLDNLPFVSTPGGDRCPDANQAIDNQIYKGTFLINYNGHGSTITLAHERILTDDDFNAWTNINNLPFMVTATCDYSRYDDPSVVSDGEQLVLKANGGTIAMLTTTAAVYASINHVINVDFLKAQFTKNNGQWLTFGEAFRQGKNGTYSLASSDPFTLINFRRFVLLGDPALQPCFPKNVVATDSIINVSTQTTTDTMSALGTYMIKGSVNDINKSLLNTFNGKLYVTIFDKPRIISLYTKDYNQLRTYKVQDNVIYKGIATVENGKFSFTFIAPKDLNYDYGNGKISYYAENGVTDAAGADLSSSVGGFSDTPVTDIDGPIVKPYMNDTLFRDGAITGSNTVLFVRLHDQTGINVTGNAVGHDLTAVLDDDVANPYILNDYYITDQNSYQSGQVSFPINGLSAGKHKFTVKAWDVNDNSGTGVVNFVVGGNGDMDIQNLMNYPNPFGDVTHFIFEHNHPGENLHVTIEIYNISGQQVKLIETTFTPEGSHSNELTWDGTTTGGRKLPNGVYPYRLILKTDSGVQGSAYQKLVLYR